MARIEHQSFSLKQAKVDDAGRFSGMGAVFGNVDQGGDRIVKGAFSRTLQASKTRPLLRQHKSDEPIGQVECTETPEGLVVQGQLELSDPTAAKAYRFLKSGVVKGLSIGFSTILDGFEDGVRLLKEVKLYELSVVTFPMNELAMVTSVKAMDDVDRARHFKMIDEHRRQINRHQQAILESLKCLSNDFDDEPADVPSDDGESSALLDEIRSLVESASGLSE